MKVSDRTESVRMAKWMIFFSFSLRQFALSFLIHMKTVRLCNSFSDQCKANTATLRFPRTL